MSIIISGKVDAVERRLQQQPCDTEYQPSASVAPIENTCFARRLNIDSSGAKLMDLSLNGAPFHPVYFSRIGGDRNVAD